MTTTHEQKALELAARLTREWHADSLSYDTALEAADELRRLASVEAERDALKEELEDERMRHAACGIIAMSNTRESAAQQRQMLPKYRSASVQDVERAVDREMSLREELAAIKAQPVAGWVSERTIKILEPGEEDWGPIWNKQTGTNYIPLYALPKEPTA